MKQLPKWMLRLTDIASIVVLIGAATIATLAIVATLATLSQPSARSSLDIPVTFSPSTVTKATSATFGTTVIGTMDGHLSLHVVPSTAMWFTLLRIAVFAVPTWLFLRLLHRILDLIDRGEAFSDDIVRYVRWAGAIVIAFYAFRAVLGLATWAFFRSDLTNMGDIVLYPGGFEPVGLVVGFAVLMLADVFRGGTVLRSDADLTV